MSRSRSVLAFAVAACISCGAFIGNNDSSTDESRDSGVQGTGDATAAADGDRITDAGIAPGRADTGPTGSADGGSDAADAAPKVQTSFCTISPIGRTVLLCADFDESADAGAGWSAMSPSVVLDNSMFRSPPASAKTVIAKGDLAHNSTLSAAKSSINAGDYRFEFSFYVDSAPNTVDSFSVATLTVSAYTFALEWAMGTWQLALNGSAPVGNLSVAPGKWHDVVLELDTTHNLAYFTLDAKQSPSFAAINSPITSAIVGVGVSASNSNFDRVVHIDNVRASTL
jgi:hypothetical protein